MSTGIGLVTILGCLQAGENLVGMSPSGWECDSTDLDQFVFADLQAGWRPGLRHFSPDSLRSFATNELPDLIKKMREWRMRLDKVPDGGRGAMYMISQLREQMEWLTTGVRVERDWPEAILQGGVQFFSVPGISTPVVRVDVKGGDQAFFFRHGGRLEGIHLFLDAIGWLEARLTPSDEFNAFQTPFVLADIETNMNWILGLRNAGYFIAYAQQKILFGMNEKGFAVREETALTAKRCIVTSSKYILSPKGEPFLFWRRRPGVSFPISMFQFTRDHFQDPGDLHKIVE